jgi:hypothetical protein
MIEKYCKDYENEFEEDFLFYIYWKKFRTIKNFFISFSRIIFVIKEDSVSIDRTLFIMDILIKYLQETTVNFLFIFFSLANSYIIG